MGVREFCLALVFLFLCLYTFPMDALVTDIQISPTTPCSRTCESQNCWVPQSLRYGKYCGVLYGGCPGEAPCDDLDACCKSHDDCIDSKRGDYLSVSCNQKFLNCIQTIKNPVQPTFENSSCSPIGVVIILTPVFEAALALGRSLNRP